MTPALIGREHPARVLRTEITRTAESHGGLLLVTGEPGIGKTTLVTEAAQEARELGALVLTGACWDSGSAPGYWPWVQIVRALRRWATPEEVARAEEAAGGGLGVLLGEVRARAGAGPGAGDDPDAFALHDAVTSALVAVSQERPVLLVLDDLHWADPATLKLLEFAAGHAWFERLVLVGTYRDAEVETAGHPLRELMLPLVAKATTVTLTGFDRAETRALMTRTAGREPSDELVAEVHRRTGGNPFFVEQTARLWASGASVDTIAPGVREMVRRRLDLLPDAVSALLSTGAVLGREFHRQVLAAVAGAPAAHVDRLLDQAVTARLVTSHGGGRFGFVHDLVRETLHDALDEGELKQRHAAFVRAWERVPAVAAQVLPGELAQHAYAAGDAVPAQTVVRLLREAAQDAGSRLATEEGLGHLRRAVERAAQVPEPGLQVITRLALADSLRHGAAPHEARREFEAAVDEARALGSAELMARVALSLHGHFHPLPPLRQGTSEELLREAHSALGGRRSAELTAEELAQELSIRTAVLARRHGDDDALGFSLWARHHAIWGPGTAAERVALVEELTALTRRMGDVEGEHFARALTWVGLVELADPRYLSEFQTYVSMAEQADLPRLDIGAAVDQAIITALAGRFAESEAHTTEAAGLAERDRHGGDYMLPLLDHHRWALAMLQGRHDVAPKPLPWIERIVAGITAVEQVAGEGDGRGAESDQGFLPLRLRLQA
ncbi:AAA family ATPase, partial [Streptomyces sp. YC504]